MARPKKKVIPETPKAAEVSVKPQSEATGINLNRPDTKDKSNLNKEHPSLTIE